MKKNLVLFTILLFCFCFVYACAQSNQSEGNAASQQELAPDFKLSDLQGNEILLSSYINKKPVILVFWTTRCDFCRDALRVLNVRYPELSKNGWELLAIDAGDHPVAVERFVMKYNLVFKVLLDKFTTVASAYGVYGVPTYVIIDKKGKVIYFGNYLEIEKFKDLAFK
ncbi:MAG: redoxin domain-containing protein [Candidatus Omnitrophica bacterium]|nr:redoxin domain-containing protein [Candidatus Omnitrophota bacterium]MBU1869261.1 redoxin domain-containing protein [Candidatus Omnitrophota bacterium]